MNIILHPNIDGNKENYIKWDTWYTPVDDIISVWAETYGIDLRDINKTLTWDDGLSVPSDFQMVVHMTFNGDGKIYEMFKNGNELNKLIFELHRGIPYGETTEK